MSAGMASRTSAPQRRLLHLAAIVFGTATILYSTLWMFYEGWHAPVQLGFDNEYVAADHSQLLTSIYKDSPAERAGLRAGDRILKVDGKSFENPFSLEEEWARHRPGNSVELTIERPGVPSPVDIKAVFRAAPVPAQTFSEHLSRDILNSYPIVFLIVGLTVLFLRLKDRSAWLVALMFAGSISVADFPGWGGLGHSLRSFAMAYRAIFNSLNAALFYFFFAVFPVRSSLDRRMPWLKWAGLALGAWMGLTGLRVGYQMPPAALVSMFGARAANWVRVAYAYGFVVLGLISLLQNALDAPNSETRRKIRVIVWGTLLGVAPVTLGFAVQDFLGYRLSLRLWAVLVLLLYLFPISFAYAVVKHRVLEIPVLLKRSARYMLVQRGFVSIILLVIWGTSFAFVMAFTHFFNPGSPASLGLGLSAGVTLGGVLTWGATEAAKRGTRKIDRAFFRNAYDARVILEELGEQVRTGKDRRSLASMLERQIRSALHPDSIVVHFKTRAGLLAAETATPNEAAATLSTDDPLVAELARRGKPWEIPTEDGSDARVTGLSRVKADCLVPILAREGGLIGLIELGARLSEEPYSGEDKRLLASVAGQVGTALESLELAEEMATRIESEKRAAQEMEFARDVQARLLPQHLPRLQTLEYACACVPARQVGGDYYDFLELRPGRVALVLADVSGKGVSGALLMANLQANLRSQYARAFDNPERVLASVNRLFYDNTADNNYATLFFGDYEDSTRRLRYVNCGHLAPLVVRAACGDNADSPRPVERLNATATVLGLFPSWECSVEEIQFAPGDLLVLYTDGVTEAVSPAGEEFGENRLADLLRDRRHLDPRPLLEAVVHAVKDYARGEQSDDITLVVARCKSGVESAVEREGGSVTEYRSGPAKFSL